MQVRVNEQDFKAGDIAYVLIDEDSWKSHRDLTSAQDVYLKTNDILKLCAIDTIFEEDGNQLMTVRWFCKPEETCFGRRACQGPREVLLVIDQIECLDVTRLVRHASVVYTHEYDLAAAAKENEFVCNDVYDSQKCRRYDRRDWLRISSPGDCGDESDLDGTGDSDSDHNADSDPNIDNDGDFGDGDDDDNDSGNDRDSDSDFNGASDINVRAAKRQQANVGRQPRKQGGLDWKSRLCRPQTGPDPSEPRLLSNLQLAQAALTLSARPSCLPCRDKEKKAITNFLVDGLSSDTPTIPRPCLYVVGVPGTGKTATVLEVVETLQERADAGELPAFQFAEINGLRCETPKHAYSQLLEAVAGVSASPGDAMRILEDTFAAQKRKNKPPAIVLVDEVDMLATREQSVLYNLFDWPLSAHARMVVIVIANTLDLPERLLPRIASRLGNARVVFDPYNAEQIISIVQARLEAVPDVVDDRAVLLAARKVSNTYGDVRRALELLRRAAEVAERRSPTSRVIASDVTEAAGEMFNSIHIQVLRGYPDFELVFLASVILEARYSGRPECKISSVAARLSALWNGAVKTRPDANLDDGDVAYPNMPPGAALSAARRLEASGFILMSKCAARWGADVSLNVPSDDVVHVIQNIERLSWLHPIVR